MDEGVSALIIVCGFVAGAVCIGVSMFRRRRRHRREIGELARWLGGRWAGPGAEVPPDILRDPLTGAPYSNTDRPYDRALWATYRGRTVLLLEYTVRQRFYSDGHTGTRKSKYHSVKVLGPRLPDLVLAPQRNIPTELYPGLRTAPTGVTEFDDTYDVRAAHPEAVSQVVTPPVGRWLMRRSEPFAHRVTCSASGLETSGSGGLPGWTTSSVLNELCDLADLVQYGAVQRVPRLERRTVPPIGNRALTLAGIGLCIAAAVFWIAAFTVKDPGGGVVVVLVLAGLVGLGVGIERMLNRKARRKRQELAPRQRAFRGR